MAKVKFDLSVPSNVLLACKYSAQTCNLPLSAWIGQCCCARVPISTPAAALKRMPKPEPILIEKIAAAPSRSVRVTISCPTEYKRAWVDQVEKAGMNISPWVLRNCMDYLAPEVRSAVRSQLPVGCTDLTTTLGHKLFKLFFLLNNFRFQKNLLLEIGVSDIRLSHHIPKAHPAIITELEQLVDRMLELANNDDSILMGPTLIDSKLRLYFLAAKPKLIRSDEERRAYRISIGLSPDLPIVAPNEQEQTCMLRLNCCYTWSEVQKLERMRVAEIFHSLRAMAQQGASIEELMNSCDPNDAFTKFVSGGLDGKSDLYKALGNLKIGHYLSRLDEE